MSKKDVNIVIITPCRNEEEFLPDLIDSMIHQTLRPTEWIIVDDGSTDSTSSIVIEAAKKHNWIKYLKKEDRGKRSVGPGVVEAFYFGYESIENKNWDYICKLDGDLLLSSKYFERLLFYFDNDIYLGAASGKLFLQIEDKLVQERNSDESVWGCANFYRKQCFIDIEGFVHEVMWDGIAFHRARMKGWRTRSIHDNELKIIDRRIMGSSDKSIYFGRRRWGRGQYFIGTHPFYLMAIAIYRLFERPFILGGLNIFIGYFFGYLKKSKQYEYPNFKKSLHAWQFERLKIGKRLENIPVPQEGLYQ